MGALISQLMPLLQQMGAGQQAGMNPALQAKAFGPPGAVPDEPDVPGMPDEAEPPGVAPGPPMAPRPPPMPPMPAMPPRR